MFRFASTPAARSSASLALIAQRARLSTTGQVKGSSNGNGAFEFQERTTLETPHDGAAIQQMASKIAGCSSHGTFVEYTFKHPRSRNNTVEGATLHDDKKHH
eukprot:GDKK01058279.1.p3 GENE.GDKK01058279.1~~GDKK01058279.1.p3  ORF type:complete len:102 (-),score=18.92 GDKK01058279.1:217-522(-)